MVSNSKFKRDQAPLAKAIHYAKVPEILIPWAIPPTPLTKGLLRNPFGIRVLEIRL
jgi:hypothetical protein